MPRSAPLIRKRTRDALRGFILLWMFPAFLFFFLNILLPADGRAFEKNVSTEFEYSDGSSTSTDKETGNTTETDFSRFSQLYRLSLSRNIYPYLTVSGGGLFKSDNRKSTFEGLETETTQQTIRPYGEVIFNSPLYGVGISYRDTEIKDEATGSPTTKKFTKDMSLNLKYNPAGLPSLKFFYNRVHNFDDSSTADSVEQLSSFKASYLIKEKHPVNYTYTHIDSENRITDTTVLLDTHQGNAGYSRSFFNNRLSLTSNYKIRYNTRTIPADSTVEAPVLPSEGLFSTDPDPLDEPLTAVTELIDGEVGPSSGIVAINIGWIDDGQAFRNIGINFGLRRSVDKIFVYVNKNIPANARNSFIWSIYRSNDGTAWTPHATVSPAAFGAFQNRFEISFPEVNTQFIKVVTSPLAASVVIGTPEYPDLENILVTEIEAFITTVTTDEEKLDKVDHSFGLNLIHKLSGSTNIGYTFFYTQQTADPSDEETTYSNGFFLNHIINKVFTFHSRITRDDKEETTETSTNRRYSHAYSASLRADYLETFKQTLTYNIGSVKEEDGRSTSTSLFLRNDANLYRGWDAFLDLGYNWGESVEGESTTNVTLKTGTDVQPNRKLSLHAQYLHSRVTTENGETETSTRQSFEFSSSFLPYRTLSFTVRFNLTSDEKEERTFQNYAVNWSPFPDGDLQFFSSYNETLRRPDNQRETTFSPGLRWKLTRYALLNVSYFFTTIETAVAETETQGLRGNLKMNF